MGVTKTPNLTHEARTAREVLSCEQEWQFAAFATQARQRSRPKRPSPLATMPEGAFYGQEGAALRARQVHLGNKKVLLSGSRLANESE